MKVKNCFLLLLLFSCWTNLLEAQDADKALEHIDQLRQEARKQTATGALQQAIVLLDSARAIAVRHELDSLHAAILTDTAEPYAKSGNFTRPIKNCILAYTIFDSLDIDVGRAEVSYLLANLFSYSGDTQQASTYYQKAIQLLRQLDDRKGLASVLNNYAILLNRNGQYQQAEDIIQQSIQAKLEQQDTVDVIHPYLNMAENLDVQGRYEESFAYLEKAYVIAKQHNLIYETVGYFNGKGMVAMHAENYSLAEESFLEAFRMASHHRLPHESKIANNNLVSLYKKMNAPDKALSFLEKANSIKDSLNSLAVQKKVQALREQYEATVREKEVAQLKEEQALQKLRSRSMLLLFSILSLLLIGAILYQQLRSKKNRELAALKEEQLQQQIALKNQQLTTKAMEMIRKNDFLESLQQLLANAKEESTAPAKLYSSLANSIALHSNSEEDWQQFQLAFNSVHQSYINHLSQNYPELSTTELRHCALLKLGLSIKETASLFGINPASIKMARNRIKKKLQLSADDQLQQFLMSIPTSI